MKLLTVVDCRLNAQKQRIISKITTQAWRMMHYDSLYFTLYYSFDFFFHSSKEWSTISIADKENLKKQTIETSEFWWVVVHLQFSLG